MLLNLGQGYNPDNFEAVFREFLNTEGISPITIKNYLSDLRHFLGWLALHINSKHKEDISQRELSFTASYISYEAVLSYKTYLESNSLPLKTINRRLSTLRKFCTLCIKQGWMKENPAKKVANIGLEAHYPEQSAPMEGPQDLYTDKSPKVEENTVKSIQITHDPMKILDEFKTHLSSQTLSSKEISLIMEDVNEFFSIINS